MIGQHGLISALIQNTRMSGFGRGRGGFGRGSGGFGTDDNNPWIEYKDDDDPWIKCKDDDDPWIKCKDDDDPWEKIDSEEVIQTDGGIWDMISSDISEHTPCFQCTRCGDQQRMYRYFSNDTYRHKMPSCDMSLIHHGYDKMPSSIEFGLICGPPYNEIFRNHEFFFNDPNVENWMKVLVMCTCCKRHQISRPNVKVVTGWTLDEYYRQYIPPNPTGCNCGTRPEDYSCNCQCRHTLRRYKSHKLSRFHPMDDDPRM